MDWDVLFDGLSIADKIVSFDITKGRGRFCKELTLEVADYSLRDSVDLSSVPEDPLIEVRTNTGNGWISEGVFFIERCTTVQSKDAIILTLWGRDESARLTQPFARKISKEYDEDTTLYEIIEEILTLTSTKDAIIRTQTYDNPFVNRWKERGDFEERRLMIDRWNQQIVEIATQYDIPVARVYRDFNGPNGDQDPGDKGYISTDGMHNNDAGARRIAQLLQELGYEPLDD